MRSVNVRINVFLDEGERDRLIASIPDREWLAVRQVLLASLENTTQYSANPDVSREHGLLAFYSGAVGALRDLLAQYEELRTKGREIGS